MSNVHQVSAFILPKLTSLLPSKSFQVPANIQKFEIEFFDSKFHKSGKIDIILGMDIRESKSQETCLPAKRFSDRQYQEQRPRKTQIILRLFVHRLTHLTFNFNNSGKLKNCRNVHCGQRKKVTVMNIFVKIRG